MKYGKEELLRYARECGAKFIETYRYTDHTERLHTDFIRYIGECRLDEREIGMLPFNEEGEIEADVRLMDREEYESTVEANCEPTWEDAGLSDDDRILIIVIRYGYEERK